jgi:hypothetical protein
VEARRKVGAVAGRSLCGPGGARCLPARAPRPGPQLQHPLSAQPAAAAAAAAAAGRVRAPALDEELAQDKGHVPDGGRAEVGWRQGMIGEQMEK